MHPSHDNSSLNAVHNTHFLFFYFFTPGGSEMSKTIGSFTGL